MLQTAESQVIGPVCPKIKARVKLKRDYLEMLIARDGSVPSISRGRFITILIGLLERFVVSLDNAGCG